MEISTHSLGHRMGDPSYEEEVPAKKELGRRARQKGGQAWRELVTYAMTVLMNKDLLD